MLLDALSAARDIGRLQEIAVILIRHGLGDAVRRLGLAGLLKRAGRAVHWKGVENLSRTPEVRFRTALEELGPTFVKLGQMLAGRADLLPPAWTKELARLHERATEVPYSELHAQLVEDLGAEPAECFLEFDTRPLAAASIAQVHRATLKDGTPVVVKLRRPGINKLVEADLHLLARAAESIEEHMPELRRYRPRSLVRQFGRSLRNELDLRIEARNAERLRANLADIPEVVVPRIHTRWTRERLCVMDYLDGQSIGDWLRSGVPERDTAGRDAAKRIAALGARTVLRTVFVDGYFHADPHPGNVFLMPGERLGLCDFGMVGHLSQARRLEFLYLLQTAVTRDLDGVVETLLGWADGQSDANHLEQDAAAFIDRYHDQELRTLDTGELLRDFAGLLRENDLFLPNDVALLLKVFVTLDSLGRELDPDFVMAAHIEPFATEAWEEQFSALALMRRSAKELGSLLTGLPRDLRQLTRRLRSGSLRLEIDVTRLEAFGERLDRSANRLTIGVVTAALIVGTAISLTVPGGPRVLGLPLFGFLGFTSSLLTGVWVLWSILRSGRR